MSKTEVCKVCGCKYDSSERALVMRRGEIKTIHDIEVSGATIKGLCKSCLLAAAYGSLITKYSEIPEVDEVEGHRVIVLSRSKGDMENDDEGKFKDAWVR